LRSFANQHFTAIITDFDFGELLTEGIHAIGADVAEVVELHVVGQDIGAVGAGMQELAGEFITLIAEGHSVSDDAVIGGAIAIGESAFAFVFTAAGAGQVFAFESFGDHCFQQFGIVLAEIGGAGTAIGAAGRDVHNFVFCVHNNFLYENLPLKKQGRSKSQAENLDCSGLKTDN